MPPHAGERAETTEAEQYPNAGIDGHTNNGRARRASKTSRVTPVEAIIGLMVGSATLVIWALPAIHTGPENDVGLAYTAGQVAWQTGHPESIVTWISTPFLGFLMAIVSRVLTIGETECALVVVNLTLLIGLVGTTWLALRVRVSRWLWWVTLAAACAYGPAISSIWWKQFNIVALALAVLAVWTLRRQQPTRVWPGALLLALSIAIKPVAVLVLLAFLVRRDSRRAAAGTIMWSVVIELVGLMFLAIRSHSLQMLSPLHSYKNFSNASSPFLHPWVCHPENFSPQSMLCRLGGDSYWTAQRVAVIVAVLLLCAVSFHSVRHSSGLSWRLFAFGCALSPMISPIAWSHYQIMLAPLLVVLAFEFDQHRTPASMWASLIAGYSLVELVWRPYGTLPGAVAHFFTRHVETTQTEFTVFAYSAWAQFIVVGTAIIFFTDLSAREEARSGRVGRQTRRFDDHADVDAGAELTANPMSEVVSYTSPTG